ncbi:MAG: helix-turn-helix domain-containing protein [Candidatus Wallbacteria bacterium]|nr:helix-turn-helix domain-containing protein [Candidatus Wallbacteria bacterium]
MRVAAGLSQQTLAERSGLTRQAINSIEAGHYLPNTASALRLARVLGCRVDEIFRLSDEIPTCGVELWKKALKPAIRGPVRLALARLRGSIVAHPLVEQMALTEGFSPADGVLEDVGGHASARLLAEPRQIEETAFLAGCDPALGILASHLERSHPELRLAWLPLASRAALGALSAGGAHVAGSHVRDPKSGQFNVAQARRALAVSGGLVVAFAGWEQGLMVRHGNPLKLRDMTDLTRTGIRFVNREPGAGSRESFDALLAKAKVPAARIGGYENVVASHMAVARTVSAGGADAGMGLRAVAHACGLDFVPLVEICFDLAIPADLVEHRAVAAMLELLHSRRLRADLAALPGYDVSRIGTVIDRFAPAGRGRR